MDPIQDSTSETSNRKPHAENSAMVQLKRDKFFDSYLRQNFSLPSDSVIYYIAKNPRIAGAYQKMIQTCKYFFVKNPILVISEFAYFGYDNWQTSPKKLRSDLSKVTSKFWFTDGFFVRPYFYKHKKSEVNKYIFSYLLPKLHQWDAKAIFISFQIISCKELSLLVSCAETIKFGNITVKDENGSNVAVEKIVEAAFKATEIIIRSNSNEFPLNYTSNTMKELLKLPHFSKLDSLFLNRIPETFDLEAFYNYMKKNKTTKFWLEFDVSISEAYKNRLDEIIDEILASKTHSYKPPLIEFTGHNREKNYNLRQMFFPL